MVGLGVVAEDVDVLHEWLDAVDPSRFHFEVVAHTRGYEEVRRAQQRASPDVWICRRPVVRAVVAQLDPGPTRVHPVVAVCENPAEAGEAMQADVAAVVLSTESLWVFASAVHSAHRRQLFVSPAVLERYRSDVVDLIRAPGAAALEQLTVRELEVLQLLAEGRSNAQISRALFISPATVSTHVLAIFRKLEVSNRTEAALFASRNATAIKERAGELGASTVGLERGVGS